MSDPIHESNDCIGPKNVVYILYVLHTTNMERNILATEPCKILRLLFFLSHRWLFINPVHVRLTHPCFQSPFLLILMNCNSTEACYLPSSVTVQSGPGQIAPPLIMLLFLACRHNWNKAPPPSTLDGWECCLLSKTMVDYLASRLLYVTSHIIRDNSSQQLSLFE